MLHFCPACAIMLNMEEPENVLHPSQQRKQILRDRQRARPAKLLADGICTYSGCGKPNDRIGQSGSCTACGKKASDGNKRRAIAAKEAGICRREKGWSFQESTWKIRSCQGQGFGTKFGNHT